MKLRLHFVVDPMGWLCISVVFGIWLYNSFFIPKLVLLPHYNEGHIPWAIVVCYYIASALCIAALFRASTADPGRLPVDPHIPHSEREHWELCNKCNLMRPKRSHHCSRCGHCVRRMDHHCPWINNCVGEDNHWLFLQLCFYTQVLSLFTLVLDFCQYYYFQPLTGLDQEKFTTRHELALLRISALMGLVMFGGMTSLFYTQMTGILSDTTTIEKMAYFSNEIAKSEDRNHSHVYLAQRDPGSGRSLKFAALAGNSCGSSHSEAGSRSKPATTSAPMSRPAALQYLPPAQMVGLPR